MILTSATRYHITGGPGRLEVQNSLLFVRPDEPSAEVPVIFVVETLGAIFVFLTAIEIIDRQDGGFLFRGLTPERYFVEGGFYVASREGWMMLADATWTNFGKLKTCCDCGQVIGALNYRKRPYRCPNCGETN